MYTKNTIMLKKYILPILLLLIQLHTEAQKTLVLSSPQTGQVNNFASDHVQFKPGYSFKATINDWMKGYLKYNLVTEPNCFFASPTNEYSKLYFNSLVFSILT